MCTNKGSLCQFPYKLRGKVSQSYIQKMNPRDMGVFKKTSYPGDVGLHGWRKRPVSVPWGGSWREDSSWVWWSLNLSPLPALSCGKHPLIDFFFFFLRKNSTWKMFPQLALEMWQLRPARREVRRVPAEEPRSRFRQPALLGSLNPGRLQKVVQPCWRLQLLCFQ